MFGRESSGINRTLSTTVGGLRMITCNAIIKWGMQWVGGRVGGRLYCNKVS